MNTITRKSVLVVLATLSLAALAAAPAVAQNKLMIAPPVDPGFAPDFELPRFGFSSFNIGGVGERVTNVRWGGLASRFGLEPGDIILSMNDVSLTYYGSWNDALHHAIVEHGGWVQLRVRDVRTGHVVRRQMFVGVGGGPIAHYSTNGGVESHVHSYKNVAPNGPITLKSKVGAQPQFETNRLRTVTKLAN
jgi:hypothetical protein